MDKPISEREFWNNLAYHPLINFILQDAAKIVEIIEPHQDSLWNPPLRQIFLTQKSEKGCIELRFTPE